jgi:hypothetical protein
VTSGMEMAQSPLDDRLSGFRGAAPVDAKPDRVNGAEVRKRLKCATDTPYCGSYYIFINHEPNTSPAVAAVRSDSHLASAA